jgi:hypothetical protein
MSHKLEPMAKASAKVFDANKLLKTLSVDWSIRRREPKTAQKWEKNLCPMCFQPKTKCWDNGENQPDLE